MKAKNNNTGGYLKEGRARTAVVEQDNQSPRRESPEEKLSNGRKKMHFPEGCSHFPFNNHTKADPEKEKYAAIRTSFDTRKADYAKALKPRQNVQSLSSRKNSFDQESPLLSSDPNPSQVRTLTTDPPAGKGSEQLTTEQDRQILVTKSQMRKFTQASEEDRKIHYSRMQVKDHSFYNKQDSLWNEPERLEPKKYARYSEKNTDPETSFKKTITDFQKLAAEEKEKEFISAFKKLSQIRKNSQERYQTRKLERHIWQYMASQNLSDEQIAMIQTLASDDPSLFEELSSKKKWTYVVKNPDKALKDQSNNIQTWNFLNHLPKCKVDYVVTDKVLDMDRNACENLLNNILEEKKQEDERRSIQQQERLIARNKTVQKHNQQLADLESIGVKLHDSGSRKSEADQTQNNQLLDISGGIHSQSAADEAKRSPFRSIRLNMSTIDSKLDKYSVDGNSLFTQSKLKMRTQFASPKTFKTSDRTDILALPKTAYHGKDFFQRQEFRGLFLADHQEALGDKAFKCVDSLNNNTVNKFNSVQTFKESITAKKNQDNFYKADTKLKSYLTSSYKTRNLLKLRSNTVSKKSRDEKQDSPRIISSKFQIPIEGSAHKLDTSQTITREKDKMAATFGSTNGEKFLPNTIQTPYSSLHKHSHSVAEKTIQAKSNSFHRTAFSTFTPLKGTTKTQNSPESKRKPGVMDQNPYAFGRQILQEYQGQRFGQQFSDTKKLMSQVPKNSSQIDFSLKPHTHFLAKRKEMRQTKPDTILNKISIASPKQQLIPQPLSPPRRAFHAPPIRQPIVARQPNPRHLIGLGYQHHGMTLNLSGATEQHPGVFISRHRKPIISLDQTVQCLHPPPFANYVQTGELLSDPDNSLAAISKTQGVELTHSMSHLKSDNLKHKLKKDLENQNSQNLFQSKHRLYLAESGKMLPNVQTSDSNTKELEQSQSASQKELETQIKQRKEEYKQMTNPHEVKVTVRSISSRKQSIFT